MPEDRGLVPELTVEENILVPVWVNKHARPRRERLALVYQVLPELAEMRSRRALLLSGGQQKLVALARAHGCGHAAAAAGRAVRGRRAGAVASGWPRSSPRLKGSAVSVLIAQSDLNHSRKLVDAEFVIERGANVAGAPA